MTENDRATISNALGKMVFPLRGQLLSHEMTQISGKQIDQIRVTCIALIPDIGKVQFDYFIDNSSVTDTKAWMLGLDRYLHQMWGLMATPAIVEQTGAKILEIPA
jgi:hypothetical protein